VKEITLYTVTPKIPARLGPLRDIAQNLWFCWNIEAIDLFRSIDSQLWEETHHNPIEMLGRLDKEKIDELLEDEGFLLEMERVYQEFSHHIQRRRPYEFGLKRPADFIVAYFSMEYALTDCLPIYSGGLGVLSADHLKSASDLCINMVGIGLLYQKGYFRQYLNPDGWQLETYPDNDFHNLPIILERDKNGDPLSIKVEIEDREVKVRIWRIDIGRIPLWMLDTNTVENDERDREITFVLYGGDESLRLKQEAILGIGGIRALNLLGIKPAVYHMNEGHSALAIIERIRTLMETNDLSFEEAKEAVFANSIFTTHTPVPAGIDIFSREVICNVLGKYISSLGLSIDDFLSLGNKNGQKENSLNMAILALKHSAKINGVSQLHGIVSRRMWNSLWDQLPEVDVPIDSITNGIHIPSWISGDLAGLFDRYLGRRWTQDPDNQKVWDRIERIPDAELWRTHERRRERLISFARQRLISQLLHQGARKKEIQLASEALDPKALTIGFARRFATYKRGDLIFYDPERVSKILNNPEKPVQIIFAGKAHPKDSHGKEVIKNIIHLSRRPEFRHRVIFIEDYDLNVARYLVQGVDVWLNTPRRPLEACGTSGMKAAANGVLNISVLDGWWAEGYNSELGWAIGSGEEYEDQKEQDSIESQTIYNILENEVVPLFYERGRDNLPREWIRMMKLSMKSLASYFNSHRMLQDYLHRFYVPSALIWDKISSENFKFLKDFTSWARALERKWSRIEIIEKRFNKKSALSLGENLEIEVDIYMPDISSEELSVNVYHGPVDSKANFVTRSVLPLQPINQDGDKITYKGEIPCLAVGRFGVRIQVIPSHPLLVNPYHLGLILWG